MRYFNIIVIIGVIVAVAGNYSGAGLSQPGLDNSETAITGGLEIRSSISGLTAISDIVVRGTVTGIDEEMRTLPVDNTGETRPHIDRCMLIKNCYIEVTEYLKGKGPKIITVFQSNPVSGIQQEETMELKENEEYLLFLFSTADSSFWGDGYIIQGPTQGCWRVKDGYAIRPFGLAVTMLVEELRKEITSVR